jgi:hypothetical protein
VRANRHALVNVGFIDGLRLDGRFLDHYLGDGSVVRVSKRRGREMKTHLARSHGVRLRRVRSR